MWNGSRFSSNEMGSGKRKGERIHGQNLQTKERRGMVKFERSRDQGVIKERE